MKIIAEKARIDDIADAVRQKLNVETQYKLSEIPAAINSIYVGGELEPLSATANGDYTPGTGIEGFSRVHVAVPGPTLVTKNIVSNGTYNSSSDNADGYSSINVNVPGGVTVEPLEVTENGTYNPPSGVDGYAPVTVNVSGGTTQESISPILPDYVSSFFGSIIVDGNHAKLSGRVDISSTASGARTYLIIPEGYRPAGYYIFSAGRAATTIQYSGYIDPNGNVVVQCNQSYFYLDVEWVIADETVAMLYDTSKINTITGDLAIVEDVAYLNIRITGTSSAGWSTSLLTIPSGYRPVAGSEQTVFARSVSGTTVYDTTTSDSNENISVYLPNGSFDILISGQWKIAAT